MSREYLTPILLIGIFLVISGIITFMFLTADDAPVVVVSPEETPLDVSETPQQDLTLITSVQTKTGTRIAVRDFLKDEDVSKWSAEAYLIGEETSTEGTLYQIFYFQNGGGITVSLLTEPLRFARERAETELIERLGVTTLELCALQINVTTPRSVSEALSGRDLGLSICPVHVAL